MPWQQKTPRKHGYWGCWQSSCPSRRFLLLSYQPPRRRGSYHSYLPLCQRIVQSLWRSVPRLFWKNKQVSWNFLGWFSPMIVSPEIGDGNFFFKFKNCFILKMVVLYVFYYIFPDGEDWKTGLKHLSRCWRPLSWTRESVQKRFRFWMFFWIELG